MDIKEKNNICKSISYIEKKKSNFNCFAHSFYDFSPVQILKLETAHKSKEKAEYWINHYKFKQYLKDNLKNIKRNNTENRDILKDIVSFYEGSAFLRDNLYKISKIYDYSVLKLGNNISQMESTKKIEEINIKKIKEEYSKIAEKFNEIIKKNNEIDIQQKLLSSIYENIEIMKNKIDLMKKENGNNISSLCYKLDREDKDCKILNKYYNFLCNITKYRIISIENKTESQTKLARGYFLNIKNGNLIDYDIKIKNNESIENKATDVFSFWRTIVKVNKIVKSINNSDTFNPSKKEIIINTLFK